MLNSLFKHPSGVPPRQSGAFRLRLWASQFLFLCELQHYIVAFGPKPSAVFATFFGFESIPLLFIPITWSNPSYLVGFCAAKSLFVYLQQYWNPNRSKFSQSQSPQKNLSWNSQFCKGNCHPVYSWVYNSWVVVIRPKTIILLFPEMRVTKEIFNREAAKKIFFDQFNWIFKNKVYSYTWLKNTEPYLLLFEEKEKRKFVRINLLVKSLCVFF